MKVDLLGHGAGNESVHIVNKNQQFIKDELSLVTKLAQKREVNPTSSI